MTTTKLRLDSDEARTRLGMCYALLIRLANEKATEPETLEGEPGSVASTSDEYRCTTYCTTGTGAQQEGGCNG